MLFVNMFVFHKSTKMMLYLLETFDLVVVDPEASLEEFF